MTFTENLLLVPFLLLTFGTIIIPYLYLGSQLSPTFKKKQYWVVMLLFQQISARTFGESIHFLIIIFYYLVLTRVDKRDKKQSLFLSLFLFLLFQSVRYLLVTLFMRMIFDFSHLSPEVISTINSIFHFVALFISVFMLKKLPINWELFFSKDFKSLFDNSFKLFIPLATFRIFSSFMTNADHDFYQRFDTTVSVVIFTAFFVWWLYVKHEQQAHYDRETIKQQEEDNRTMQETVNKLGSLYNEIRGFRHDFGGIIASMEPALARNDVEEIRTIYQDVFLKTNEKIKKADYTAFNLQNIEDTPLRNVLAKTMISAQNQAIPVTLQTTGYVRKLDIPMLEAVRLLSILTTNALEAAVQAEEPKINLALVADGDNVTFIIENTHAENGLNPTLISQRGYSSKGDGHGNGLAILEEIVLEYDLALDTHIGVDTFTQVLEMPMRQ